MAPRFALYLAPPPDHPLHTFAAGWLGWDPERGLAFAPKAEAGLDAERIAALTVEPRRYGFHGTLKPPFRLREDCDEAQLIIAIERFAATRRPIALPVLKLASIGRFLALCPSAPCEEIDALAADCVRDFDRFRAPPSEQELARRRAATLSARQERYLQQWGYPYVMEEFRLHFTLTGRIADAAEHEALQRYLTKATERFTRKSMTIDEICLFVQPAPDANFRIAGRYRFAG
ncbi:MAG TPA: DUF1045 domain-containing protein [Ferrovibrio sp.]|jgi:putative phosphonate metabolism protein|uniref:DUF1045 domain-containing protein n=1 Tax=Ferrovibrio sp. TaxID=1917215 RepID=UPI002ECFF1A2